MYSIPTRKTTDQLSIELARLAGVKLRPPRAGESNHSPAGELRSRIPSEFFQWRKCPIHDTWLQPVIRPFPHWRCFATCIETDNCKCDFMRSAKLRTKTERRIFNVMRFLESEAGNG